jgi:hypothetical protein
MRKPSKEPKFPQNLRPISLLSTTGKLFEKVIIKILQKNIEERLKKYACLMQDSSISVHVTARHYNV